MEVNGSGMAAFQELETAVREVGRDVASSVDTHPGVVVWGPCWPAWDGDLVHHLEAGKEEQKQTQNKNKYTTEKHKERTGRLFGLDPVLLIHFALGARCARTSTGCYDTQDSQ